MEKREFFLRRPFLQFAPAFGIIALLYIPAIVQLARGGPIVPIIAADGDGFAAGFWSAFGASFALSSAVMTTLALCLIAYAAFGATKQPFLVLDEKVLKTNGLAVIWGSVGTVTTGRTFGMPCLRIATVNDTAMIAGLRFPLKIVFGLRVFMYGAPIFVPEVKDVSLDELRELIETYRANAAA
jgi:hypothetical protein